MNVPEYVQRVLEHAPSLAQITPPEPNLRGWWIGGEWYVCANCAGRVMARGSALPSPAVPVWRDRPEPYGVCVGCEGVRGNPHSERRAFTPITRYRHDGTPEISMEAIHEPDARAHGISVFRSDHSACQGACGRRWAEHYSACAACPECDGGDRLYEIAVLCNRPAYERWRRT